VETTVSRIRRAADQEDVPLQNLLPNVTAGRVAGLGRTQQDLASPSRTSSFRRAETAAGKRRFWQAGVLMPGLQAAGTFRSCSRGRGILCGAQCGSALRKVAGPDSAGLARFPRLSDVILRNTTLTLSNGDPHLVIVHPVFGSTCFQWQMAGTRFLIDFKSSEVGNLKTITFQRSCVQPTIANSQSISNVISCMISYSATFQMANEKLNTQRRCELFKIYEEHLGIKIQKALFLSIHGFQSRTIFSHTPTAQLQRGKQINSQEIEYLI
jgi:hypothetical protein